MNAHWAAIVMMMLFASTTNAAPAEKTAFSCVASSKGVQSTWKISTAGRVHLSLRDKTGVVHSCGLELIHVSDLRHGLAPAVEFSAERIRMCTPRLPKDLAQTLSVDHRLRLPLKSPGEALLSFYRADNDIACRYKSFDQNRFSDLYKQWKLRTRRIPNQPPAEGPDDIVRSAKGELREKR